MDRALDRRGFLPRTTPVGSQERQPARRRPAPWSRRSGSRQPYDLSSPRQNSSRSGGPPSPERHAAIDQARPSSICISSKLLRAGVDVPARSLERSRQRHRVSGRLGGGAGRVRPDDERRIRQEGTRGRTPCASVRRRRLSVETAVASRPPKPPASGVPRARRDRGDHGRPSPAYRRTETTRGAGGRRDRSRYGVDRPR